MAPIAAVTWLDWSLNLLGLILGLVLILVILIQRGRGGGLAGAFGAAGGSSAFGSRAGDLFTRFTLILAAVWIGLLLANVWVVQHNQELTEASNHLIVP
jgi:preprotein translocase subunit SecG